MRTINNVYRNLGASVLPQIVNIVSNFVLPVMIIGIYGSAINGLVSTVRTLISYISLVGAGIAVATTQSLYAPVAKNDAETVKGMLKATSILYNKCGWIFVGIVVVMSLVYPFGLKDNIDYLTCVFLLLIMSISGVSEFFVVGRCRSLLYACQKVYVCTTIQAVSLLISLLLAVIMLKMNLSILLVQFGISFVYITRAFFLYSYVNKYYPHYKYSKETKPIQAAVSKRKDAMIHQLSGLLVFGSQSVILASFVGLEAASIYAVYNIVFSGIHSICSNLNSAVTPFMGRSLAISNKERIEEENDSVEFLFFILTSFVFMVTVVMIRPFILVYTKDADISYDYPLFALLFVVLSVFNVFRLPDNAMINAAGHFRETRWRAIAEGTICIIGSLFFTSYIGLYGVLIGTLVAIGWRCIDIVVYTHNKILHNSFKRNLFRLLRSLAYVSVFYFVQKTIVMPINNYVDWILCGIPVGFSAMILLIIDVLVFERDSFKVTMTYIKR